MIPLICSSGKPLRLVDWGDTDTSRRFPALNVTALARPSIGVPKVIVSD
jgi:hypothetical protein